MKTTPLLIVCALVAFSGCTEAPTNVPVAGTDTTGGNETADPTPGPATGGHGNGTGNIPNAPPVANLTADVINGTAPLNVTFTIDASDPDGDNLTWIFKVGNVTRNGSAFPATIEVALETGTWNATATVHDEQSQSVANLTIVVMAAEEAPSAPVQAETVEWAVGNAGCGATYEAWAFGTPAAGITHGEVELAQGTAGLPFQVTASKTVPAFGFIGFDFYDADGFAVASGAFEFSSTLVAEGVIPTGAAFVLFNDCGTEGEGVATIVIG